MTAVPTEMAKGTEKVKELETPDSPQNQSLVERAAGFVRAAASDWERA
jgi:hypothetical protein